MMVKYEPYFYAPPFLRLKLQELVFDNSLSFWGVFLYPLLRPVGG